MKIALCIKQVPDTADIKWTENNTIQREGVESVINPFDLYALEAAVCLKEKFDGKISVFTMGPPQAESILRKAVSVGGDEIYLLTDKKFAASDTVATSRTLAAAIKKVANFDLVLCGQFATDGDTAQTAPSIAQHLDWAQVTYVKEVINLKDGFVTVKREVEDGYEIVRAKLPAVLCMIKSDEEPRRAKIEGFKRAQRADLTMFGAEDLGLTTDVIGIKGSPTYVSKAFRPEEKHGGEIFEDVQAGTDKILEVLDVRS